MDSFSRIHQDRYGNDSNTTEVFSDSHSSLSVLNITTCVIISVALPLTLAAIFSVYSLIRNDHTAPIYVINLLVSDVIQLCCLIVRVARHEEYKQRGVTFFIYNFGLIVSIFFMMCISLERYLVVACPLWYRFRQTIRISVLVCVVVWVFPPTCILIFYFLINVKVGEMLFALFLVLPLPLFIFSLVGTLRALSASRIPSDEKKRVLGILVLVLAIYVLLFLPSIIMLFIDGRSIQTLFDLSVGLLRTSPLADTGLYVFMKRGTVDKLLSCVCRCRMDDNDVNSSTTKDEERVPH
ncbi:uncharacterized protein V6R79_022021 [Siganus canaliculatus]